MDANTMMIVGIVALVVVLVGFVLIPFLKKKGLIHSDSFTIMKQVMSLVEIVLQNLKFENDGTKNKVQLVVDLCEKAVSYVEQTSKFEDNQKKKDLAVSAVIEMLKQSGVEIDESAEKLIEIGIESAVMLLPKTYSN